MRESIIIIEDFYDNPDEVREYALQCNYYKAYDHVGWYTSESKLRYITDENISK